MVHTVIYLLLWYLLCHNTCYYFRIKISAPGKVKRYFGWCFIRQSGVRDQQFSFSNSHVAPAPNLCQFSFVEATVQIFVLHVIY